MKIPFNRRLVHLWCDHIIQHPGGGGRRLELLVSYLLQTVPGLWTQWRRRGRGGEVDVVVRNLSPAGLPLPWLGEFVLVECKDRSRRVTTSEMGSFLSKLILTGIRTGIIVSRTGLTGSKAGKYATEMRDHAFSRSGISVLDLLVADLAPLDSVDAFLSLLQSRYEQVRLGT